MRVRAKEKLMRDRAKEQLMRDLAKEKRMRVRAKDLKRACAKQQAYARPRKTNTGMWEG